LKVNEVSIPPAGKLNSRGHGWSEISVHFEDAEANMLPGVTIKVHVPYEPSDTCASVRERTLLRAREVLEATSATLKADLAELSRRVEPVRPSACLESAKGA
jgi:hypothetical protein